jgi:threonine dehydrogenase-like Zn-dependent dehydrogenase
MKAVVFADTRSVMVDEVSYAVVEEPSDVVVRVTSSAICGTDLHMYDGRTGATAGLVLGHEPLGVSGRARPGVIVTHHGRRDDAAALYQQFDQRANGVIKAVLCPWEPNPVIDFGVTTMGAR